MSHPFQHLQSQIESFIKKHDDVSAIALGDSDWVRRINEYRIDAQCLLHSMNAPQVIRSIAENYASPCGKVGDCSCKRNLRRVRAWVVENSPPAPAPQPSNGYYSYAELADRHDVDKDRLRKRLDRWRKDTFNGWRETTERTSTEARYVYQESAVTGVITALKKRPATGVKRPALTKNDDFSPMKR